MNDEKLYEEENQCVNPITSLYSMSICHEHDRKPELGSRFSVSSPDGEYRTVFQLVSEKEGECISSRYCSHCSSWNVFGIDPSFLDTEHRRAVNNGDARDYGPEGSYCTPEVKDIIESMKCNNYINNYDSFITRKVEDDLDYIIYY